jgi:metal-responsive CopG/Arc/MetJ family transcriptional regulator
VNSQINVRAPDSLVEELERAAQGRGICRSVLVRELIRDALAGRPGRRKAPPRLKSSHRSIACHKDRAGDWCCTWTH